MAANKPYYNYMAVHGMSTTTTTSSTIHNDDGGGDDDDDDNGAAGVNVPLCGQHHQLLTMTMAGRGRKQQQQPAASLLTTIAPMPPARNNSIANLFSMNRNPQVYSYEHNKLQRNHQGVAAVPGHHSNNSNTLSNAVQNSGVLTTWGSVGADLGRPQILANDDNDEDAAAGLAAGVWPPRSYHCTFCRREFRSAQALGGHMNVHRRDRARLRQSSSPPPPNSSIISQPPDALSATTATTTTATPPAPHPPTGTTIFSPDFFFSAKPLPTKYLMPSRASDSTEHNRDLPAKIYSHNHPRRSGTPFNHPPPPPPPPPTTTTTTTTTTTKSTHDSIDLQILRSHSPRLTKKPFKLDHGLGMDTNYKFEYPGVNPPSKLVDLELRLGHDIVK